MDKISCLIILRSLFLFSLVEKGWCVKKSKHGKNLFELSFKLKK
jgi:hypothetical protein